MVDPGSPRRGCQSQRWGRQPVIWPFFPRKLHENERDWTERGMRPWRPSLGSDNVDLSNYLLDSRTTNTANKKVIPKPQAVFNLICWPRCQTTNFMTIFMTIIMFSCYFNFSINVFAFAIIWISINLAILLLQKPVKSSICWQLDHFLLQGLWALPLHQSTLEILELSWRLLNIKT